MPVPTLDYRQHQLSPAFSGGVWTVVIRHDGSSLCHPVVASDKDYFCAVLRAKDIVDAICAGSVPEPQPTADDREPRAHRRAAY